MRKSIVSQGIGDVVVQDTKWLDLATLARAELTSEDPQHPIESALDDHGTGWQASVPGEQSVRLLFDQPQRVRHIHLQFDEGEEQRTQEFVLRWSADNGRTYREILRQQYNFSPPQTSQEVEDYNVDLPGVTALELTIVPDIERNKARASLARLALA